MSTIPQNQGLLKHLFALLQAHRAIFQQERTYQRVVALVLAEIFVFARHTITQLLMSLGQADADWSSWYRLLSQRRFRYEQASEVLFGETLKHVGVDEVYVVAGDATQTPRSSRKLEGSGWLRNLRTPPFMAGIHAAQRWFNGCWMLPPEAGNPTRYCSSAAATLAMCLSRDPPAPAPACWEAARRVTGQAAPSSA